MVIIEMNVFLVISIVFLSLVGAFSVISAIFAKLNEYFDFGSLVIRMMKYIGIDLDY